MKRKIHFITHAQDSSEQDQCLAACKAGVDLVQLRMKHNSKEEILNVAKECREICNEYNTLFIINDHLDIALQTNADGVHLGLKDLNTKEARESAPKNFIIGGTANTIEDIIQHYNNGVDYVGVGPFRHTSTKENLSPIVGVQGYTEMVEKLKDLNIDLPLVAIGGIKTEDVSEIYNTGFDSIAISSLFNNSDNKENLISNLKNSIKWKCLN